MPVRAITLLVALAAFAAPARAATPKGPGPFANVEIADGNLVFDVKSGGAQRFTGSPKVFAAVGAAWVAFSSGATISNDGGRLTQKGAVDGVPIDTFFADGEVRRVLVRNGTGGETELDLYRIQNGFLQAKVNRSPSSPVPGQPTRVIPDVAAAHDQTMTIALAKPPSSGLDVVVAVNVPPLDDAVNSQSVNVFARDDASGAAFFSQGAFASDGATLYRHITLPPGTYRFTLTHTLAFGNPLVATGSMTFAHAIDAPVAVSSTSRLFEYALPHDTLPALPMTALTVAGLEPFEPSVGAPLNATLSITAADNSYSAVIQRDSLVATPLSVTLPMPAIPLDATLFVQRAPEGTNGVGYYEQFRFAPFTGAPEVTLAVPPLARVSGTILDPGFVLLATDDQRTFSPSHLVAANGTSPDGTVWYASGVVRGFARGYSFFAPRGASASPTATLSVGIGQPTGGNDFSENDSGTLQIPDVAGGPVVFDADTDVDVQVPDVARPVMISGKVTDAKGRPVKFAFVIATTATPGARSSLVTYVDTAKDGSFTLRLPRGDRYTLTAYGPFTGY